MVKRVHYYSAHFVTACNLILGYRKDGMDVWVTDSVSPQEVNVTKEVAKTTCRKCRAAFGR